jgi:hypothetical protein
MCKTSDAGNLNMPKRSHKVLPLSEKVKVQYFEMDYIQTFIIIILIYYIIISSLYYF